MRDKKSIQKLMELLRQRSSCRKYKNKQVSDSAIGNCLEAARLAPSACNKQPWRFIIVRNTEKLKKICNEGLLPGIPMPWLNDAPVIVVLCSKISIFTHKIAPILSGVDYSMLDIGIAGEHFVLAAEAQGLGTCWIGWFKEKKIKNLLNIPKNIKILSLISLGYPENVSDSPPKKSIEEITNWENWNE